MEELKVFIYGFGLWWIIPTLLVLLYFKKSKKRSMFKTTIIIGICTLLSVSILIQLVNLDSKQIDKTHNKYYELSDKIQLEPLNKKYTLMDESDSHLYIYSFNKNTYYVCKERNDIKIKSVPTSIMYVKEDNKNYLEIMQLKRSGFFKYFFLDTLLIDEDYKNVYIFHIPENGIVKDFELYD